MMEEHSCTALVHLFLPCIYQVMKLMLPHFKYTLDINGAARGSLISGGGIIEQIFSAGDFAMRLSSIVYRTNWRFATQALPEDLKARYVHMHMM